MNTQDIELPPLPKRPEFVGPYTAKDMQAYARAAIEADRKRSGEPVKVPSDMDILELWSGDPTHSRPVMGKNKVLAFARALLARYTSPQPTESCASLISSKTTCGSKNGDCDSQPAEPLVKCTECGAELIQVRPGKWQHPDCSQSSWAAEPVKVPSFVELKNLAIEYGIMAGPILQGSRHAHLNEGERFDAFIHALRARY